MRASPAARAALALAAALVACLPRRAFAGNTDSFLFSDDAALAGGAVAAGTRDSGAVWYNPAGLGGATTSHVNLSASVLILRLRDIPGALTTTTPGAGVQKVDLSSADFTSSPHALGIVRNLSPTVSVGFGVYVTALELRTAESQIQFAGTAPSMPPAAGTYQQRVDLSLSGSHYDAGPAIGWQIAPNLRIGASLFGTYAALQGSAQYLLSVQNDGANPTTTAFLLAQNHGSLTYFGAQAQGGVQWDVVPALHVGAVVRSPEVTVGSSNAGSDLTLSGFVSPGQQPTATFSLTTPTSPYGAFTMVQPLRAVLGASIDVTPRMWIAAEGDYQTSMSTSGLAQKATPNVRVGWRWQAADAVVVGAGAFTDLSTQPSVGPAIGNDKVDYYGATAGLTLLTPLALAERPGGNALVLSTTLAARYAIGFGDARVADIDLVAGTASANRTASVVYHEIVPYIGSGIAF